MRMRCDYKECCKNKDGKCTGEFERKNCVALARKILVEELNRNEDDGK